MAGAFNTDTNALRRRAELNAARGRKDLEDWLFQQIPSPRGRRVLDLGCGTGKQMFRLAPLVTPAGSLLGIDLSQDAVLAVNRRAAAEGLPFVEARQMSLDDCVRLLAGSRFDLILSTYALYYATDQVELLQKLRSLLSDGGVVFVCGPAKGTNREIIGIVNRVVSDPAGRLPATEDFMSLQQIVTASSVYSRYTLSRLNNEIVFDSAETVMEWWEHHNSFRPSAAADVRQHLV
jgi:ubiquinone/menaquinone biosynthesis C-methylase UbiE